MTATGEMSAPAGCTLAPSAFPGRLAQWSAVLGHVAACHELDGGIRLDFDAAVSVAQVASLMVAEQLCCAFFAFSLTVDDRGVALEVRAPAEGLQMVRALAG